MKNLLINCTLIIVLLTIIPNLTVAQTTMTFQENYDGSTTVKNENGTIIGYIKNDPYSNDSHLVLDRFGNLKARISKNRRILGTDPILLEAFRQSTKPQNLSTVDYDKVDKSFDKLNRSIQSYNQQERDFMMRHPEAYRRYLEQEYQRRQDRINKRNNRSKLREKRQLERSNMREARKYERNKQGNSEVKNYMDLENDGSSKKLRKLAKLYDFDDRSKAGVINKTTTKIFKTPDVYSEIQGHLVKDEFIELRKIKGDFAYVSYVNTQQSLSYGWIKFLDFSYIY